MKDPVVSWRIRYRLLEKDPENPGKMKLFEPSKPMYVGHVVADTAEEAEASLRRDFNMLTVETVGKAVREEISLEEYDRN